MPLFGKIIDAFNSGHKAYYDNVPRYKNPCLEGRDDSSYEAWSKGWDSANSVHELFTKNQSLEEENKQLCGDNKQLTSQNKELSRTRANLIMFLGELRENAEQRRWFQFSREKIIQDIDYTLEHLEVPD